MQAERRVLCISLHDVAPATLGDCRETLEFLDSLRIGPVALLVVPDYHGLGRADRDGPFCEFLRDRERRGDEIVLHGFWHLDLATRRMGLRDWIERRVYTAGEGEFSRLDDNTARTRILRGLAVLRLAGWQPRGFVAPAWLMSPGTRAALDSLPFRYCATRDLVIPLGRDEVIRAPSLVVSTRSAWRRFVSPVWNESRARRQLDCAVLRAALHPRDLRYRGIERVWRRLLGRLAERTVLTEGQLVTEIRELRRNLRATSRTRHAPATQP
jgi:predicted deacetylase